MLALDILAFGAHPDDVEIGAAGTIIKHVEEGKKAGICDFTLAELSSNGTVEIRQEEAKTASKRMGLSMRMNLELPDRNLVETNDVIGRVVEVIRKFRPTFVLAPYWEDRHPDHEHASQIVREAVFSAGIHKFQPINQEVLPRHYVGAIYYYFINNHHAVPQFVVDVSDVYDRKMEALSTYESQFKMAGTHTHKTVLNQGYLETVKARDRLFGNGQGVMYAEGFIANKPFYVNNLF